MLKISRRLLSVVSETLSGRSPMTCKIDSPAFRNLFTPQLIKLSDLFEKNNYELRIAGGAVRDLLMGITPADVDFASTATPTEMKDLFEREQIRMLHKRGEEHGTITCRIDDAENFEITTLRIDLICDGRRAEVKFTTDWELDANRRDLTINSMFLKLDGTVVDYFGGIEDVKKRRVAFVGDPVQRIQEDYLRILRYFRFFGRISSSQLHEEDTLKAIIGNKNGLKGVSPERIWVELKRIVIGRMAPEVMMVMLKDCDLNELLGLPANCNLDRFEKVFSMHSPNLESMTMIACLCEKPEDIAEFHKHTKLSNAERYLAEFILQHRTEAEKHVNDQDLKWFEDLIIDITQRPGRQKMASSVDIVIQLLRSVCLKKDKVETLAKMEFPKFEINGVVLMSQGVRKGPIVKNTLEYLFELWTKSDYTMTQDELLQRCHDPEIPQPPSKTSPSGKRKANNEDGNQPKKSPQ